jgi:hypothetical protein
MVGKKAGMMVGKTEGTKEDMMAGKTEGNNAGK